MHALDLMQMPSAKLSTSITAKVQHLFVGIIKEVKYSMPLGESFSTTIKAIIETNNSL
jgi:hypothetical protein